MNADVDVILAAHGAGDGSAANALVTGCARRLERAFVGLRARAAFRLGAPSVPAALDAADRPRRLVIPMLTSDGHHASRIRDEVTDAARVGSPIAIAPVLGTHPDLVATLAHRVRTVVAAARHAPRGPVVLVIGHGTPRHPGSAAAARAMATRIAATAGVTARAAFLDERPTIEEAFDDVAADATVVVLPFLLGGGDHTAHDVPSRVAARARRHGVPDDRIHLMAPLGGLSVVEEVLERAVLAGLGPSLRLTAGARGSLLSRRQVGLVAAALAPLGVDLAHVAIETRGDRDRATPLDGPGTDDAFTAEIDDALRSGRIDIAVHSLKDLPLTDAPGIINAAILPRASAHEVLVSRGGARLSQLPAGARVGTSCARRAGQLRRLRPDLAPVSIRGDVPTRIAAVDRGEVDAVILAAAGLERLGLTSRIADTFALDDFLPAPAQGAIVVQCPARSPHRAWLRRIDDRATRLAVEAERGLARRAERNGRCACAAHATVRGVAVTLRGRLIDRATLSVHEAAVHGRDAAR